MVDCHMHMVLDGDNWRCAIARHETKPAESFCRSVLARYRDQGFTYLRDGGDRWGVGALARQLAPEYGITYRTPLAPLSLAGNYGGFIGVQYHTVREYAQLVVHNRQMGADFIKIMVSGLMDFDHFGVLTQQGYDEALIRELIHIAHEEGMAVMAHANGADTVTACACAGVDSVEHGAYLDRNALAAMKDFGTVWVPTVSTVGNLRGKGRFCEDAVRRIFENLMENVAEFASMDGHIAPGTDAGAWAVPHGVKTEYEYLQQDGVLPEKLDQAVEILLKKF